MVTKLVVGLTGAMHEEFVAKPPFPEMFTSETVAIDTYVIPASCNVTATETLEWTLNTELPGVAGLISTVEAMKTRLLLKEATIIKRLPIDGYNSFSLLFGLVNYVPNPAVTYTEFTDEDYNSKVLYPRFGDLMLEEVDGYGVNGVDFTRILTYAVDHDTTDYLLDAYPTRSAAPAFNVRFNIGERNNIPQRTNTIELDNWFNTNKDAFIAKGWDLDNPKTKVGGYVAGRLAGDPWEQYLKFVNNPYICDITIIGE